MDQLQYNLDMDSSSSLSAPLPPLKGPWPVPEALTIYGRFCVIEPLSFEKHAEAFWAALSGEDQVALFRYMLFGPFENEDKFSTWFKGLETAKGRMFYSIIDKSSGNVVGIFCYMSIVPEHGSIELGSVTFTAAMRRSRLGTEAVYLMMKYAMHDLKYRRFEWKCDNCNLRSKAAAARYGFTLEGVFRQHMVNRGCNRDTAYYSIIDREWIAYIDASFQAWLADDNFDKDNNYNQLVSLKDILQRTIIEKKYQAE